MEKHQCRAVQETDHPAVQAQEEISRPAAQETDRLAAARAAADSHRQAAAREQADSHRQAARAAVAQEQAAVQAAADSHRPAAQEQAAVVTGIKRLCRMEAALLGNRAAELGLETGLYSLPVRSVT